MRTFLQESISKNDLEDIFRVNKLGKIIDYKMVGGGEFNTIYFVQTTNGKFIIKIAPSCNKKCMRHEQGILSNEVEVYIKLQKYGVKVPKIFAYSVSEDNIFNYLIMEYVVGSKFNKLKFSSQEKLKLYYNLGKELAKIHGIKSNEGFGFAHIGLCQTWKEAYLKMVSMVQLDAEEFNIEIPYRQEISTIIKKLECFFDDVKEAQLVHGDMWGGNIIFANKELCFIDCERAYYGDVVSDFLLLNINGKYDDPYYQQLLKGYNEISSRKIEYNQNFIIRSELMKLYFGLVLYTEVYYRYPINSITFKSKQIYAKRFLKNTINFLQNFNEENHEYI